MGKPSSSCLKIIACGSDSPVEDGIGAPEGKGSSDKRGWSFRKRSARHRVLNNSVTTENLSLSVPQSTSIPSQTAAAIPEKDVDLKQSDEKPLPPSLTAPKPVKSIDPDLSQTLVDAAKPPKSVQPEGSELQSPQPQEPIKPEEVSEAMHASESLELVEQFEPKKNEMVHASESPELIEPKYEMVYASEAMTTVAASISEPTVPVESKSSEVVVPPESPATVEPKLSERVVAPKDDVLEESMVVDVHTDVSEFLAEGEFEKMKSIDELQAAIRGHLVRRQAVDTLYCMQSLVKVQSLVKSRHSGASGEKILTSQSSIEKLLGNAFARRLLDSTPKSKSTVIKCDPLKPSPSRLWLERWMDLYSYGLANLEKVEIRTADGQSQLGAGASRVESQNLEVRSDSTNPQGTVEDASETSKKRQSYSNLDQAVECQTSHLSPNEEKTEHLYSSSDVSFDGQLETSKQKDKNIQPSSHFLSSDHAGEIEDPKISTKGMASKQVELESKKLAYGSKKSSNPSFIAAQSKFEELSSTANYSGSLVSTNQISNAGYDLDTASFREESSIKEKVPSGADSFVPYDTRVNIGGSENGTELSVTSALDSPYLSEAEAPEVDLVVKYGGERSSTPIINESLDIKTKVSSTSHESNSPSAALVCHELDDSSKPLIAADFHQPKQVLEPATSDKQESHEYVGLEMTAEKSERSAPDVVMDSGSQTEKIVRKSSPGASPNNDSHRTPSSQVSGKKKKSKVDKSESNTKHNSLSAGKKTPAKPTDESGVRSGGKKTPAKALEDSGVKSSGKKTPTKSLDESGVRSSAEHLSKDQKSEKRRNSFGSTKSENNDQEPRDSISSTKTLPSYMQATKSAKAKVNSPRSSPDVHDSDTYMIKKRHSLPGAGGRQLSPRVQRPTSQATQSQLVKASANTPPQERKWIR